MTKLLPLLLLLPLTASAQPRQYKIAMKYFLDGKHVSSPTVVVNEGKTAELSDVDEGGNGTFVAVTPTRWTGPNSDNQVHLRFVLGKIVQGKRLEVGRPSIVALEGEEASMEMGERDKSGKPAGGYKISALPTREN